MGGQGSSESTGAPDGRLCTVRRTILSAGLSENAPTGQIRRGPLLWPPIQLKNGEEAWHGVSFP